MMRRVVGVIACGFTLAACSGSVANLDFLKSSAPNAALRFETVPPGAEVKASGQTCRTPCELKLQVAELSVTFALKGYQPQTISVHSENSGILAAPRFVPNPVHADLRPRVASVKQRIRSEMAAAASNTVASIPAEVPTSATAPEATAPNNSTAWTPADVK